MSRVVTLLSKEDNLADQEVTQKFVIIIRNYGDPDKLKRTTLLALASALHYGYKAGLQLIDEEGKVHEFLPEAEMGKHHTKVVAVTAWHVEDLVLLPEYADALCQKAPPVNHGQHCYHYYEEVGGLEPDPRCCYCSGNVHKGDGWRQANHDG